MSRADILIKEIVNRNMGAFADKKIRSAVNLRKFFELEFLNNEFVPGKNLARNVSALSTITLPLNPNLKKKNLITTSFFFNPKFKFGFAFSQKIDTLESAVQLPLGYKFKIGVYATSNSFSEEQHSNYFLHYTFRNQAFSPIGDNCFKLGAQFTDISRAYGYRASNLNEGRSYLSRDAEEIASFFYKKVLSRRNVRSSIYRALQKKKKTFHRTPFF